MQERSAFTSKIVGEEVLHLNPLEDPQQCEVTMLREDKNKNGKRNPETQITGKKATNLSKKIRKIRKIVGSCREDFAEGRLAKLEPRRNSITTQNGT
jgi:hypothetical protein